MKITKFVHSCVLVEVGGRTALFDPGIMSESFIDVQSLENLDDIFITHEHVDHFSLQIIKDLVLRFPDVQITSTSPVVDKLDKAGISAYVTPQRGVEFFRSPHENIQPLAPLPLQIGVHYQQKFTHPGDSHSFTETSQVLALPMTGPWATSIRALNLALELQPQYVIPIHDWQWNDDAREHMYSRFEQILGEKGITFLKPETGKALRVDV